MDITAANFPQALIDSLIRAATPISQGGGGGLVDVKTAQILFANTGNNSPFPVAQVFVLGNVLTAVRRQGQITILDIRSYTNLGEDSFNEIELAATPNDNDIFILRQKYPAQNITVSFSTGVNVKGQKSDYLIGPEGGYIALMYNAKTGNLQKIFSTKTSNDETENLSFVPFDVTISGGVIDGKGHNYLRVQSERTASTAATATWQVTGAGSNATVELLFEDGVLGPVRFGYATFVGTPTDLQIVDGVRDAINALTAPPYNITAVNDGVDLVTISFDANIGAGANGFAFFEAVTGGLTSTIAVPNFAGGVDGSDQDDTLDQINGVVEGQPIIIENVMPANSITLSQGVGNVFGGDSKVFGDELFLMFAPDPGTVMKFTCCKRQYKATRWVDPLGGANGLRNPLWMFQTITQAIAAAATFDTIKIMNSHIAPYNERDLLTKDQVYMHFDLGAYILYTGAANGAIFVDDPTPVTGVRKTKLVFHDYPEAINSLTVGGVLHNGSGTDRGVFNITNATSYLHVVGGDFQGLDYTIQISDGYAEFHNCKIRIASANPAVIQTGGTIYFKDCIIEHVGIISGDAVIARSGGKMIFDNCTVKNAWNNAAGDCILDTAAANDGLYVFKGGGSTFINTHASAYFINTTNAQDAKKEATLYVTNVYNGTVNDTIQGGAALLVDTQNVNVE